MCVPEFIKQYPSFSKNGGIILITFCFHLHATFLNLAVIADINSTGNRWILQVQELLLCYENMNKIFTNKVNYFAKMSKFTTY